MECKICHQIHEQRVSFKNMMRFECIEICEKCHNKFDVIQIGCRRCGRKTDDTICGDCLIWETKGVVVQNTSVFYYNAFAKDVIYQIKFNGDASLIPAFKNIAKQVVKKRIQGGNFISIPVPLHDAKLSDRGFNQAELIANLLPFHIQNNIKKKNNITQSKRTKQQRMDALDDFEFLDDSALLLRGKRILIVDDIYTTGSTIHQIAALLYRKGVSKVESFTLFRS